MRRSWGEVVTFECSGTIIVPQITLNADTTINNPTGENVTLSGNNTNLVLLIREERKVDLINLTITQGTRGGIWNWGGTVTLTNCTVSGNSTTETRSGGISNENGPNQSTIGTMSLIDTTVSDNSAASIGGGIYNPNGTMTLTRSTVSTNSAASIGGGIYNNGTMTLTDSTVLDNSAGTAGGILNYGQMTLTNSTVLGNRATDATNGRGGGITSGGSGPVTLTLTRSIVSRNSATAVGGGLHGNGGTVTITDSTVSNNTAVSAFGGGIANLGAQMTITNSTISGNTAGTQGGGIENFISEGGQLTVINSTLSGNTAGTQGGGIYNYAPLTLTHVTFAGNGASQGSSLYIVNNLAAVTSIANTLMASSSTVGNCVDAINLITDGGYNLASDNTCHLTSGTSLPNTDPKLGPLANNGGLTQTHALLAGSPAIDWITFSANGCGTTITTDQRGVTRPQGAKCDIGAYEVAVLTDNQPPVVSNVTATPNPAPANTNVALAATVDDTTTGNSNINSADYNVDGGGTWTPMSATDDAFNSPTEQVKATLTFAPSQAGTRTICVRGTDAFSNVSTPPACTTVTVSQGDTTSPVITPTVSGTLGNNGWYTSNVTVSWAVVDNESAITDKSGCDTTNVTTDTAGVTFTCSATSSGGTASKSVTIQRDATPPSITESASPAANANGWRNGAVTVNFTCTDVTSGIAACTAPITLNEGANQSASGTATDKAGNTANTQVTNINVDLTAPVVSVTGVANGASYPFGSVPAAGCTTTDALSGVQTNATLSVTGGDANGVGTFTASCTGATDKAGNTGTASVTYQVTGTPPGGTVSAFSAFSVNPLRINQRLKTLFLVSNFNLGKDSSGIDPVKDTVTLTIANFTTTIPAGAFRKGPAGVYAFAGKINDVSIEALIRPLGSNHFGFQAAAYNASLTITTNPVPVGLVIGDDSGTTSVNAVIK